MSLTQLCERIEAREAVIGVIGLGYVGLPVACMFARAGFRVMGVDVKADRIATINAGCSPIEGDEPGLADLLAEVVNSGRLEATSNYDRLREADVVLIDVETPVDDSHRPGYVALKSACRNLGPQLREGALVIVESTLAPGTMDGVVRPLLEETTGRKVGESFYLGDCPERVMPGKLLKNLRSMSRVCGGASPETSDVMICLYRCIVDADLDPANMVTAEVVKTGENAYRDVQIAFANEVALICEAVGANVWQVRELINKSPFRQMHLPGAGVGGHCIPKDPWLLASAAGDTFAAQLIPAARAVNSSMPLHMADLTATALLEAGVDIAEAKIAVLGYAYLENSDDTRNSPSKALVARLQELGAEVVIHDPWVAEHCGALEERARGCDAVVLMVAHSAYRDVDWHELRNQVARPILVDGRHMFSAKQIQAAGWNYRCLGNGSR